MSGVSQTEKRLEFLREHDRLADLFVRDRFAFEKERQRSINETIDEMCCSEERKDKLREQQKDWDRILKGAGSAENRFAMIQALFWHKVVNDFQPALQKYVKTLHSHQKSKKDRCAFILVKK